ncbi:hypothetical protein G6011_04418 [Alternaria panax]|uniref:Uncharacterized protein n=1 Tax=Alternaria panax TaxID=48097 RepID=A0AAD4IH71_9PLEO|nr:hypothetical protein G6011_04418 [Alternaria panax]
MTQPIDPVRIRIFSELNLQLAQHDVSKNIMNETSKHLAFLSRYYLNDPCINPLNISVPIISVPIINVPVVSPGGEVVVAHKIALAVHETAKPSPSTINSSSVASIAGPGGTSRTTTTEKKDGEVKTGVSVKKIAGTRRCPPPSSSTSATTPASPRPRIRVLIQMIGTMGHQKCLIGGLCAITERVIGGLLEGDEEMVDACETSKKGKGGKKIVGKNPVWDVVPWEDHC